MGSIICITITFSCFSGEDGPPLGAAHMAGAGRTVPARFRDRFLESRDAEASRRARRRRAAAALQSAHGPGFAVVVFSHQVRCR